MPPITEYWKVVPDHDDYEVSNLGRVRSWRVSGGDRYVKYTPKRRSTPKILKQSLSGNYFEVQLGSKNRRYVHILVLLTFVGPKPEGMEARHGPKGRHNNSASNLSWGTHKDNMTVDWERDGLKRSDTTKSQASSKLRYETYSRR